VFPDGAAGSLRALLPQELVGQAHKAAQARGGRAQRGRGGARAAPPPRTRLGPPPKALDRADSRPLGKRRRDYDFADMVAPSLTSGGPKFVERVQVRGPRDTADRLADRAALRSSRLQGCRGLRAGWLTDRLTGWLAWQPQCCRALWVGAWSWGVVSRVCRV
jgi:hypothetical protein